MDHTLQWFEPEYGKKQNYVQVKDFKFDPIILSSAISCFLSLGFSGYFKYSFCCLAFEYDGLVYFSYIAIDFSGDTFEKDLETFYKMVGNVILPSCMSLENFYINYNDEDYLNSKKNFNDFKHFKIHAGKLKNIYMVFRANNNFDINNFNSSFIGGVKVYNWCHECGKFILNEVYNTEWCESQEQNGHSSFGDDEEEEECLKECLKDNDDDDDDDLLIE